MTTNDRQMLLQETSELITTNRAQCTQDSAGRCCRSRGRHLLWKSARWHFSGGCGSSCMKTKTDLSVLFYKGDRFPFQADTCLQSS
ncbi:hypothetical protein KIL84_012849 [Mauremys mutica]|uniref:Uncharacterized protein n=1 Tax=Mauremys mutica TaxID=74926 RepID=A0A9D3XRT0_9SAUR|nr:hypothetical protein KIL84_012849 [Mauremys mutica]